MAKRRKKGEGSVRQRKDGRWEGRVVIGYDGKGLPKTKNVLAKTKRECQEKLKQLRETVARPTDKVRPEMPFGEWLDFWYQNYVKPQIRPTTQANYETKIYQHIIPELGKIPLNQLSQKDLQQFYARMKTGGRLIRLDFKTGALTVNKQVYEVKGQLQMSVPKTRASIRKLVLPPGVVEVLRQYRETVDSRWMFPSPVKEDVPMTPGAVRRRLQIILERAGCRKIRFHDLRHTFATLSLENGMDVKTLSAMLGHVSAATTLDIYTHVTGDMQSEAAAKIDRGLGNEVDEASQPESSQITDFRPVGGQIRQAGTGCITEINYHLFEGRYSPIWPDGTRHAKNVYAKTRKECEKKLKVLIQEMQAERQALRNQMRGVTPPSTLTKTQKKIWMYMKFHPDVTSYRAIARGAGVTRHTAAKWYGMIRGMWGGRRKKAACPSYQIL